MGCCEFVIVIMAFTLNISIAGKITTGTIIHSTYFLQVQDILFKAVSLSEVNMTHIPHIHPPPLTHILVMVVVTKRFRCFEKIGT